MADCRWWVGIDWGRESHAVCVMNSDGTVHKEWTVRHEVAALNELADTLCHLASSPSEIAAALETPHGAVVAILLERGIVVYSINPKQVDRFRDRFTVAGAKDDRRDALVLASSLRSDTERFKRVELNEPRIVELRELVRMHDELKREGVSLGNRLEEQIGRYFPQVLRLGSVHDEPWLWALLERAPRPEIAARLSLAKIETILKKHGIRRLTAEQVREVLRTPALHVAPGVADASHRHVKQLVPRLRLAHEQRRETNLAMEELLRELESPAEIGKHRDAAILRSLPGVGTVVSATMLAEASQSLAARDYQALRVHAGCAPVTKRSGKMLSVNKRYQRNPLLENAVYFWASTAVIREPKAKALYRKMRERGLGHARAIRGVADRLLAVLIAMLRSNHPYDPERRKAA